MDTNSPFLQNNLHSNHSKQRLGVGLLGLDHVLLYSGDGEQRVDRRLVLLGRVVVELERAVKLELVGHLVRNRVRLDSEFGQGRE